MKLTSLKKGATAYIGSISGDAALRNRLYDLGFLPGERVERLYASPLGTPVTFRVMGQCVALRRSEAAMIDVVAEPIINTVDDESDEVGLETAAEANVAQTPAAQPCGGCCGTCSSTRCPSCLSRKEKHVEGALKVVVVGNPNCGKTAFFNAACGGHEHTGNYAGVTVTSVSGHTTFEGKPLQIVDLPGTYSLHSFSPDEAFVKQRLSEGNFDVIVNVVDVNHLERNLLLTLQLLRMGRPVVCVLNMYDEFLKSGNSLDVSLLSERLGVPCVTTVARSGEGVADALHAAVEVAGQGDSRPAPKFDCGVTTRQRHEVAKRLLDGVIKRSERDGVGRITRLLDRFLAHGVLALPLFALVMVGVFYLTFELGAYPMDWIDGGVGALSDYLAGALPEGFFADLVIEGIIGGVGSVIVFLPNILILYLCISLLEDSGYLARAAMLADPLLSRIGLHGKSFIPMLMGFGCNVPAVMATRTIENRKTRLVTMLAIPFMSCSARLPVYVVFCGAFFPDHAVEMMTLLYFGGIAVALLLSWVMTQVIGRGDANSFVMEIPPYRAPQAVSVWRHTWDKGRQYLRKMGGVILVASIVIWALGYFPRGNEELTPAQQQEQSYLGTIGHAMEPLFAPFGFDWRMDVGILAGTGAKELMVSTLGVLYECDEADAEVESAGEASGTRLAEVLSGEHTAQTAFAYMVFALFYFPCFATIIAIASESGRRRMAVYTAVYTTVVAYLMAFVAYTLFSIV